VVVDFDFVAGTFLNFIFSDLQSLEEFEKLHKLCLAEEEQAMKHDQLQHKSYLDIHHHQSLVFLLLYQAKDSKLLKCDIFFLENEKLIKIYLNQDLANLFITHLYQENYIFEVSFYDQRQHL
jgi:hypothetical protein